MFKSQKKFYHSNTLLNFLIYEILVLNKEPPSNVSPFAYSFWNLPKYGKSFFLQFSWL